METIDKRVKDVLKKEEPNLTQLDLLPDFSFEELSLDNEFTIPQKDTIGRNIQFNVPKI